MTTDVTVLGAGIVGICTALSLAERGQRVRVIDRREPGQETSFGNAGVISPWSIIPQSMPGTWRSIPALMWGKAKPLSVRRGSWLKMLPWGVKFLRNGSEQKVRSTSDAMEVLCAPSIDLYKRHLAGTGNEDLVVDAMYVHAFRDGSKATLKSLDYKIRQEKGADLELIGQDELRRTEPAIAPDFEAAVLIKGQARARSPGDICSVLFEKARSLGVTFLRGAIRGIQPTERGWEVSTETGEFRSPNLVLALGAWSAPFLKDLGLTPPLMAERGYHVEFRDPGVTLQNSVMDVDAKCVASSMTTGLRFAGQAEFGPVDAPPDHRKQALLTGLAKAAFPDLQTGEQSFWMGRRPSMHDSLPVMGPVERQTGLYLNFGHSHYGLMMAPKSGEILADIITGNRSNQDMSAYALSRFA